MLSDFQPWRGLTPLGTQPFQPQNNGDWTPWGRTISASPSPSNADSDKSGQNSETMPARQRPFRPWTGRREPWSSISSTKSPRVAPTVTTIENAGAQVYRVAATPVAVPPPQVAASQTALLLNGHLLVKNVLNNSRTSDFFWSYYFY